MRTMDDYKTNNKKEIIDILNRVYFHAYWDFRNWKYQENWEVREILVGLIRKVKAE